MKIRVLLIQDMAAMAASIIIIPVAVVAQES
jgi:hypothetical protein